LIFYDSGIVKEYCILYNCVVFYVTKQEQKEDVFFYALLFLSQERTWSRRTRFFRYLLSAMLL